MNFSNQPISIKELKQLLDDQELSWFLSNLSNRLATDSTQLRLLLEQEQWVEAKFTAHQLKGASYLSEDELLLKHLDNIEQQRLQLIPTQAFQKELGQALDNYQQKIQRHLNELAS